MLTKTIIRVWHMRQYGQKDNTGRSRDRNSHNIEHKLSALYGYAKIYQMMV